MRTGDVKGMAVIPGNLTENEIKSINERVIAFLVFYQHSTKWTFNILQVNELQARLKQAEIAVNVSEDRLCQRLLEKENAEMEISKLQAALSSLSQQMQLSAK